MTERSGGCLCGAVRFAVRSLEPSYGACHCKMCQRWAGSALLAINVKSDAVTWEGTDRIRRLQSSDWAERAWCEGCGSGLWYRVTAEGPWQHDYEIPIGLFDDASGLNLTREIFIDRKPDSFALDGDHDRLTEAETLALYGPRMEGA